jgi:hypothetical protein
MIWNDVLEQLHAGGLNPVEEIYMENYGKILAVQRPEFAGRYFRCAYGVVLVNGVRVETFLFPSEIHLQEFLDVIGDDPWWVSHKNVIFHFPPSDPDVIDNILGAISSSAR